MLVVVSPAKRLDWSDCNGVRATQPVFQDDAVYLARVASRLSKPDLQRLMDISEGLARLNQTRFRAFTAEPDASATRPAGYAFAGDTYQGLDARSLSADDVDYAQNHLQILSGLYGLLRPLDAIQPYRLEMGSRLKTRAGATLYAYWGARLAQALDAQAETTGSSVLVNCASQEYFSAVDTDALKLSVVTPAFLELREGTAKVISFHAKKARGAMARYIVERQVRHPRDLEGFDWCGYRFDAARSAPERPVFLRSMADKAAA